MKLTGKLTLFIGEGERKRKSKNVTTGIEVSGDVKR
jgi:hypothetical protein